MRTSSADPSDDIPRFGQLVRQHRARTGLTQRELADLATLSVRAVRNIENGTARQPRQNTVRLIADGLRLSPRARADLESAADVRPVWSLTLGHGDGPVAPPATRGRLFGRDAELHLLEQVLRTGAERTVNLVGLGGVGKTRLILEVANRLHRGARFSILWAAAGSAPADPAQSRLNRLVQAAVQHLVRPQRHPSAAATAANGAAGVTGGAATTAATAAGAGGGADGARDVAVLAEFVADRPTLLVVDGLDTADVDQDVLLRLLDDCPGLRLLVASRQPVPVASGPTVPLDPPTVPDPAARPDPDAMYDCAAVHLFLDRIRQLRPEYLMDAADAPVVADICRRLDGLPLALHAAASWLAVYDLQTLGACLSQSPASLLAHLPGVDGRYPVRDVLLAAVGRLSTADAALLTGLARQGSTFTLADAAALTGRDLHDCALSAHSLLLRGLLCRAGESRFRVPHLVRAVCAATDGRRPGRRACVPVT